MHRYIDAFFVILGVFVLSFILCGLLTAKFAVKLTVSFIVSIAAVCILAYIFRGGKNHKPDYRSFVTYCILSEEATIAALFEKAGFIDNSAQKDGFYFSGQNAVSLHLKFSKPSADGIVTLYKKCLSHNISKLTVWCTTFERKGVAVACSLPGVEIKFKTLKPLYKKLKKTGELQKEHIKPSPRPTLKSLIPVVFSIRNSYRFAFVATILYLLSFLTPLRAYYIVAGTISVALAIAARIYGEKSDRPT